MIFHKTYVCFILVRWFHIIFIPRYVSFLTSVHFFLYLPWLSFFRSFEGSLVLCASFWHWWHVVMKEFLSSFCSWKLEKKLGIRKSLNLLSMSFMYLIILHWYYSSYNSISFDFSIFLCNTFPLLLVTFFVISKSLQLQLMFTQFTKNGVCPWLLNP